MEATRPRSSDRDALLTAAFASLLVGQVAAILADRLGTIALIELLSVETTRFAGTRSAFELSKLALAMTLPALLLGPLAGAWTDRLGRKRVLVASDLVRGIVTLAIPLLRPGLPMSAVYGAVALLYVGGLFFLPARCAVVPEIVSRGNLLRANSILTLGATAATVVGFAAGGILVTHVGWRTAMVIDGGCYLLSAAALNLLRPRTVWMRLERGARVSYPIATRTAWREMRASTGARAGVLIPPLVAGAAAMTYVLGVALIQRTTEGGTAVVGLLTGLAGVGMAAGGYLTGTLLGGARLERVALVAGVTSIAALAAVGLWSQPVVIGAAVILAGIAAGPVYVASETAVQEQASPEKQATVFAVRDTLMKLACAVGAVAAPAAACAIGDRAAMLVLPLALIAPLAGLGLSTRRQPPRAGAQGTPRALG
jgi:DHA3 family macrolide efflux protein-like MFS transporter